jgi:hypothetical protein
MIKWIIIGIAALIVAAFVKYTLSYMQMAGWLHAIEQILTKKAKEHDKETKK